MAFKGEMSLIKKKSHTNYDMRLTVGWTQSLAVESRANLFSVD